MLFFFNHDVVRFFYDLPFAFIKHGKFMWSYSVKGIQKQFFSYYLYHSHTT